MDCLGSIFFISRRRRQSGTQSLPLSFHLCIHFKIFLLEKSIGVPFTSACFLFVIHLFVGKQAQCSLQNKKKKKMLPSRGKRHNGMTSTWTNRNSDWSSLSMFEYLHRKHEYMKVTDVTEGIFHTSSGADNYFNNKYYILWKVWT